MTADELREEQAQIEARMVTINDQLDQDLAALEERAAGFDGGTPNQAAARSFEAGEPEVITDDYAAWCYRQQAGNVEKLRKMEQESAATRLLEIERQLLVLESE